MQCGFCTPGMVMSCAALLARNPKPDARRRARGDAAATCAAAAPTRRCSRRPWPRRGLAPEAERSSAMPERQTHRCRGIACVGIAGARPRRGGARRSRPTSRRRWPVNAKLAVVGKPTPRLDGALKVTGAARYTADVRLPGHAVRARGALAAPARAASDRSTPRAAERYPGVRAVHVLEHLRGSAELRDTSTGAAEQVPGRPLRRPADRRGGGRPRRPTADEAARLVEVDYEVLPVRRRSRRRRMKPDAPLVFPGPAEQGGTAGGGGGPQGVPQNGNVRGPREAAARPAARRRRRRASREAEVVVEGDVPHAGADALGARDARRRRRLEARRAHRLRLDPGHRRACATSWPRCSVCRRRKVRVITEFMGGGFGAKFGAGNFGVLADDLSKKARRAGAADARPPGGAPRRRQPPELDPAAHASAPRRTARSPRSTSSVHGTGGIGTGAGAGGPGAEHVPVPERAHRGVRRLHPRRAGAAFRAPGHPQGVLRARAGDRRARREARHRSARAARQDRRRRGPGGTNVDSAARRLERRIGAEKIGWSQRHAPGADAGPVKRGIGVAQSIWYRIVDMDSACEVRITRDGSVEVRLGGAGHRHRHPHRARAGRRRGARPRARPTSRCASATRASRSGPARAAARRPARSRRRRATRRYAVKQQLLAAGRARRSASTPDDAACSPAARCRRRPTAASRSTFRRPPPPRCAPSRSPRTASRTRRLRRLEGKRAAARGSARRLRRRAVRRRSRSTPRPASSGRARGRGARLRPADQPARASRARSTAASSRASRTRCTRTACSTARPGAMLNAEPRAVQDPRRARDAAHRRDPARAVPRAGARPTPAASASRRPSRPRRRSPTRSTTRSACACASCR